MGPFLPFVKYIRSATSFRPLYSNTAEQAQCVNRDKLQQQYNKNLSLFNFYIYLIHIGFFG
jgi:hypothetical protein